MKEYRTDASDHNFLNAVSLR